MTDIATLRDLLARCEGAARSSREIDTDLHWYFDCLNGRWPRSYRVSNGEREVDRSLGLGKEDWHWWDEVNAPEFTRSIDAAVALIEWVLPLSRPGYRPGDYTWDSQRRYDGQFTVQLFRSGGETMWGPPIWGNGSTLPLALLTALLKAKIHEAQRAPGDAGGLDGEG